MRIEGGARLRRRLGRLSPTARRYIADTIAKNVRSGVRIAKVLAPERSGKTRTLIVGRIGQEGLSGAIEAIDSGAPRKLKDRQYSIEHGRKKGKHGRTDGAHHMHRTRQYLGKKHRNAIRRAIRRAVKESLGG